MWKKKLGFFDKDFSTGQNGLIGEDNIENNSNTIEPGLGEINVDECDNEQSFSRDFQGNNHFHSWFFMWYFINIFIFWRS